MSRRGKIGVYGKKTRALQRKISYEAFGLSFKDANVYLYMGDSNNANPEISDIGNTTFAEVPDRAYRAEPITIPIGMEIQPEIKADFSRFGIIDPLSSEQMFRVHIDDFETIGREIIIGDVFEVPFFSSCDKKAYWEVTDVDTKSKYERFIAIIHATPLEDSRRTNDLNINRSNDDELKELMSAFDEDAAETVPIRGYTDDPAPEKEDVDYRDDIKRSFLDDIEQEF